MQTNRSEQSQSTMQPRAEKYSVVLPCSQDEFGAFVSSLLGKAQTIERVFELTFEINRESIETFFHLVSQRINQQNTATLVQSSVKIVYDDNSSVLLNNFDEFGHYAELRTIESAAVQLTWIYLIQFPDRKFPEKQQIDISIFAKRNDELTKEAEFDYILFPFLTYPTRGHIVLRISHSARTWGEDLQSLVTNHVESVAVRETGITKILHRHSTLIPTFIAVIIFGAGFYRLLSQVNIADKALAAEASHVVQGNANLDSINQKLDFILRKFISQTNDTEVFLGLLAMLLIMGVAFGVYVLLKHLILGTVRRSFLLITKRDSDILREYNKKQQHRFLLFFLSFGMSIIASLLATGLFEMYFR